MKSFCIFVFVVALVLSGNALSDASEKGNEMTRARIIKYIAPYSYDVKYDDGKIERISLYGFEQGVQDKQLADHAIQHVQGWVELLGPYIEIEMISKGKAKIFVGGFYVQDELVKKCLAIPSSECIQPDCTKWNGIVNMGCIPSKAGLWREMPSQ
jgi:hypothetical protein